MNHPDDEHFMRRAISIARSAILVPGAAPIGCVIVLNGAVIGEGHNETGSTCDPTAHAEIVIMRHGGAVLHNMELRGGTLYSTLQPCGMCSMASIWAKLSRIVYGAGRGDVHRMYFEDRHLDTIDFIHDAFRQDLSWHGGVLAAECAALYYGPDEDLPAEDQGNI